MALLKYDEIFGLSEPIISDVILKDAEEKVIRVPIEKTHEKKDHSFNVLDDVKMAELVESIKRVGVLEPCIVYERPDGEYEMNAGHRRRRASILAGLSDLPVIIRKKKKNMADIEEVDTNINRGEPSPMEKARAYKKRMEAIDKERKEIKAEKERVIAAGGNPEEIKDPYVGIRSDQALAQEAAESRNQINRYLRLNYLIEPLQTLADKKKLPLIPAVELSYLKEQEQNKLFDFIQANGKIPSMEQASGLKKYSREGKLNETVIELLMTDKEKEPRITLKTKTLQQYFPENYNQEQMEAVILELLENWHNRK